MKVRNTIMALSVAVLAAGIFRTNAFAAEHTLEEVAEAFNNNSTVESYKDYGYIYSASTDESEPDVLRISVTDPEEYASVFSWELDDSILSYEHITDEQLMMVMILADSIGQVNGYEEGELKDTLNSPDIRNYTVENEGIEIKENGSYYSVKMDIDKKVPLVDLSDYYLTPEEFEIMTEILENSSSGNQMGKSLKMVYQLIADEDENVIYMGEKNELTQSAYKSVLSAIEVMYNKAAAQDFPSLYSDFSEGNVWLNGVVVEIDPELDADLAGLFDGAQVVKLTFDNEYMKDKYMRTDYIGETIEYGDKTLTIDLTGNNSYNLDFFGSVSESGDIGFLYKYILEPVVEASGAEIVDDTIYFNIVDGKIVVGDKDNSIFKLVIKETEFEIVSTQPEAVKTIATAKHENVKTTEYQEGKADVHERYGNYQVTVNIAYGKETEDGAAKTDNQNTAGNDKAQNTNTDQQAKTNDTTQKAAGAPKTGDMSTAAEVSVFAGLLAASVVMIAVVEKKKKTV